MKKVLVTGANGFIGRNTLKILISKGYEVHATYNLSEKSDLNPEAIWHKANLLDKKEMQSLFFKIKPTHLLHFAWYAEHGKFWDSELNNLWLQASLEILKAFKENGGKRVVAAGTCAEYLWGNDTPLKENSPIKPSTLYGICKNSFHELLASFTELNNISYGWGRIFFLYGEGETNTRLVPSVIRTLLKNEDANCTHGNQIRDFMHVFDVASAFVNLLNSNVNGPINISSGTPISIRDVCAQIIKYIDTNGNINFGAIKSPKDDPLVILGDNSRLKNEVSWTQSISLENGIKELVDFHRKDLKG